MNFKIGDIVERTVGEWFDMKIGDKDEIIGIMYSDIRLKNYGGRHSQGNFRLVKEINLNRKIIGYKLIKEYPGMVGELGRETEFTNNEGGATYVYSHGRIENFSKDYFNNEFWEPVYEKAETILNIGTKKIPVTIGDKIKFRRTQVSLQEVIDLYNSFNFSGSFEGWSTQLDKDLQCISNICVNPKEIGFTMYSYRMHRRKQSF